MIGAASYNKRSPCVVCVILHLVHRNVSWWVACIVVSEAWKSMRRSMHRASSAGIEASSSLPKIVDLAVIRIMFLQK